MTIAMLLPARLMQRILVPSGDRLGLVNLPSTSVSWYAFDPSRFITKTLKAPLTCLTNAIRSTALGFGESG